MLNDLSFLDIGKTWPPLCESERMEMYSRNRQLFESGHAEVYQEALKRIERVIGNFQNVISYPTVLNFQKLMSLKIADLLLGEPPKYQCEDQETLDQIIKDKNVTLYEAVIDMSRYGDGLFFIRNIKGKGTIDLTQPSIWYPICDPSDVKNIIYQVLGWTYEVEDKDTKKKFLKLQIHEKGRYTERLHELTGNLSGSVVIDKLLSEQVINTGLDDFAVVQASNTITSDRCTGLDDYTDIDSIICELIVRVGQIARILDKHASPSVSGPEGALEQNKSTGEWSLKMGNFFPRQSKDEPEVSYLTWDGQLTAAFAHIDRLINILYTISEMGSAIFGDMASIDAPSGTALKRLMISPLAKVNRIRMRAEPAIKKAIRLASQIGYRSLNDQEISITWQDGLPTDETELTTIMSIRTGDKPTISQKSALMRLDNLSEEDADAEMELIQEDEAMSPAPANPFEQNGNIPVETIATSEAVPPVKE